MRLIRSWPWRVPPGRAYVVDDIEHLVLDNHNYRPLADVDDDVVLLEWDIAVSLEDLRAFVGHAREARDEVLVAPYRLYPAGIWAHRTWTGRGPGAWGAEPVEDGAATCNLFGLGLVYLPRALVAAFLKAGWANHFGDVEFSMWHYKNVTKDVRIAWDVRPVHLHYEIPEGMTDAQ